MEDRPRRGEFSNLRARVTRAEPRRKDRIQRVVRLEMPQMRIVAFGQRFIDDRVPIDRIRRSTGDRRGNLVVQEPQ